MRYNELKEETLDQMISQEENQQGKIPAEKSEGGFLSSIVQGVAAGAQGHTGSSLYKEFNPVNKNATKRPVRQPQMPTNTTQTTASAVKQLATDQPVNPTGNQGIDQLLRNAGLIK